MTRGMHLAFDLSFSHTEGRWAREGSWVGTSFPDVRVYQEFAMTAERAGIDLLFFGDGSGIPDTWRGSIDSAVEWGIQWPRQDMSPFIASMAAVTDHIGFGLTYSSTFMHPFYVARLLNSLDHVTGGRLAFNVVASSRSADAHNYGFDELMEHSQRYERMEEFIQVCKGLWDSVEPGAIIADRATGRFADPSKVHALHHQGQFFQVKGPLSSVPSPQRHPVLIQAGNSPRGIAASATFADLIFGAGSSVESQQRHRAALDAALEEQGREPSEVGILWSVQAVVGRTEDEAKARLAETLDFWDEEAVGAYLSHNAGYDFSGLPDTVVLGELAEDIRSRQASPGGLVGTLLETHGPDHGMSRAEFFEHGWRHVTHYDHVLCGTADQVADALEENFEATGSRGGFMFSSPLSMPGGYADIAELLTPELRRRGALAPRYPHGTLRENLRS